MRRAAALGAATTTVLLLLASSASAHGLVGKQDLPVPKWLFTWAAAIVLIVSFIGLAVLWPKPRLQDARERVVARIPAVVRVLCGLVGVSAFVGLVYAGFAGVQTDDANILPTSVYVVFWVGLAFVSFLFGDVFRAFNPWLAVGRAAGWVSGRVAGGRMPAVLAYPPRLGYWPAVIGLFAFAWLELVYVDRGQPSTLALLTLVYAAVQLVGMSLYGTKEWADRGDAFSVYFGLFARISPLPGPAGDSPAPPLAGLPDGHPRQLHCGGDDRQHDVRGFTLGSAWTNVARGCRTTVAGLGAETPRAGYRRAARGHRGGLGFVRIIAGVRRRPHPAAGPFGGPVRPRLVPIALAYVVAHYFGLLSTGTGDGLLSDPSATVGLLRRLIGLTTTGSARPASGTSRWWH